jgi:pimeloyl-ACP methyl ester carboxylesterase
MSLHLISWAEDGPHHHEDLSGRVRVEIMVFVGHSDGGLLALMAAARALKSKVSIQILALCRCEFYLIMAHQLETSLSL